MMAVSDTKPDYKKTIPWKLGAIFILFCAIIILIGVYYYNTQRTRIFREQENSLSVIASLKIGQIEQWHNERLGDAVTLKDNEPFINAIKQYFKNKTQPGIKSELIKWMKSVHSGYSYSNVLLVDAALKVRLSLSSEDTVPGDFIGKELADVLKNHRIIMTDLHKSESVRYVHIDILIPLVDPESKSQSLSGILILRIDPSILLFPLIQSWPTPSKSSETLIVRKDGDSVLYLNELRHIRNTSLKLKAPLSNKNLLGAKAISGFKGVTEGMDYRNIDVVGYLSNVPGFPWFMVAKIDKEEILLPLKKYLILIVIVIVLLVLINASIFGFWIWDQQLRFYRKQLKIEEEIKESEEKFIIAFQMSPVSVAISSVSDNKFIDINNTFLKDMGYTREEVIGRTAKELNIWADESERLWIINEISEKRRIFGKVIGYRTRKGEILYGLSSMALVRVNGEPCTLSTVVNITENKNAQEQLKVSEDLFRKLFENMLNGFAYCKMLYEEGHPPDFIYINVNEAFESLTGLKDVKGKKVSEVIPGIQEADPELLERYGRVAVTGKPEVFETWVESLKMWFSISVYSPQKEYFVAVFDVITHRKLAEAALKENEERFRSLYENVTIGIYRTTLDGRILMANPAMVSMLGFDTFEQLEQRNLQEEGYEPDYPRSKFLEIIENDGKIIGLESAWNRRNGKALFVRESANAVRDGNGRIIYYDGTVEDITDRKKAEEALHENEKRLREAQEMAHLGFWFWDIKTGNVDWSDEVFKIFCLDPATFKPQIDSILKLSPWPENNQRDKELISRAIESHEPGTYEQKFLRPDKSIGYYYSTFRGSYDNNGNLISIVGTILDITERKQVEEALRESEDKFKYVFDHSVIGKSLTFPSGEIHVNKAFCDMLGYSQDELENTKWQDISSPQDIEVTQSHLNMLLSGEKDSVRFVKRYIHKNGSVIWTDVGTALRRDADRKPLYFMTAINNITEMKKAEEALHNLNEELEQRVADRTGLLQAANKELEAFSYSVSHDLRAPLRSVHGFTKILLEDYESTLDEEGKRICGIISSSATQMGALIDDLLSFSRIGRSNMHPSEIDMKKMARLIFEGMTSPTERERIKLNIGKLYRAFGDVTLFGQVWTNLISNAIKYTSKNDVSEINIGSKADGKMITYFIKDNGVGFDMQYAHKLFGVFQRLHSEAEFEGNGVGLAIIQRIILKHGGKVWAEGKVGKGATFYFSLPLEGDRQQAYKKPDARRQTPGNEQLAT